MLYIGLVSVDVVVGALEVKVGHSVVIVKSTAISSNSVPLILSFGSGTTSIPPLLTVSGRHLSK